MIFYLLILNSRKSQKTKIIYVFEFFRTSLKKYQLFFDQRGFNIRFNSFFKICLGAFRYIFENLPL